MFEQITQQIHDALAQENSHNSLQLCIAERSQRLHSSIQIQAKDQVNSLQFFAIDYIAHVPQCLQAIKEQSRHYGLEEPLQPFIKVAEDFFLHPPKRLQQEQHFGMAALLDEAYLAHRLFEEMNDHFVQKFSINLLNRDLTEANLIVHELIGDPFASELDQLVNQMARILAKALNSLDSRALPNHKSALFDQFPGFTDPHGLSLKFA